MEDGSWWRALRIKHIKGVVPRLAGVNNKRQVQFVRKLYLLCEYFSLNRSVRMVVVVIEAAFTNSNNSCRLQERRDCLYAIFRIVRVQTNGGIHVWVHVRNINCLTRGVCVCANHNHGDYAGVSRCLQRMFLAARNVFFVHVTVRVDPLQLLGHRVFRGKSGSPFTTAHPPGY